MRENTDLNIGPQIRAIREQLTVEAGAGNLDEPITHPGEEFVHCLEGKIEYCVGDQIY